MIADDGNLRATAVVVLPAGGRYAGAKRSRSPSPVEENSEQQDQRYRQSILKQMFDKKAPVPTALDASCEPLENARHRDTRYMSRQLPRTKRCPAALTYICRGPTRKGKFDPNAAKALGVKPGPLFGRLQRGETIHLEDGTAVRPDQVMAPDIPGHVSVAFLCFFASALTDFFPFFRLDLHCCRLPKCPIPRWFDRVEGIRCIPEYDG